MDGQPQALLRHAGRPTPTLAPTLAPTPTLTLTLTLALTLTLTLTPTLTLTLTLTLTPTLTLTSVGWNANMTLFIVALNFTTVSQAFLFQS